MKTKNANENNNREVQVEQLQRLTINMMADLVHNNAKDHGFHKAHENDDAAFLNYQLMNLIVEAAELHTAWREGSFGEPCDKAQSMIAQGLPPLTCAEEEYADILIRTLDQCRRLKIDIARAVAVKHLYNVTRPHMHGGKLS